MLSAHLKCTVPLFGSEISRLYCQFWQTPDEYSESCKSRNKKVEAFAFVIAHHDRCAGVCACEKRRGHHRVLTKHCTCAFSPCITQVLFNLKINVSRRIGKTGHHSIVLSFLIDYLSLGVQLLSALIRSYSEYLMCVYIEINPCNCI